MRIAELAGLREFRLIPGELPPPAPGEIQVRVRAVGICGSDVHYYDEGQIGDTPCVYPMVLGHEPAGEIVALGEGVSGWSAGDAAILEPAVYCYHCEHCLTGHHNVCSHLRFLSMPGDPGFFRDYVNLPAGNVLPAPAGLSHAEATLFEPLAVALHSLKWARPGLGETALVFGAGPIGLLTIASLKFRGVGQIFAVEPLAHRREMAWLYGATDVIDPAQADPVAEVLRATGGRGVDMALDCATKGETINQCLHATRYAGRVVITGIPSTLRVSLEFHVMRRKEIEFFSSRRSNHETGLAVQLLREHPKMLGAMLTHSRPLEQIGQAFDIASRYADSAGKVLVEI
ncbi:MAG: zinc-binding dehydrogenase [Acidobacteria bacterium]|nr:zinc-binding dehydrogenase [Acidobacteriota bacterium]